mgnify:FL=1
MNNEIKYGDKLEIYYNLHKKCFSVRHKGLVVKHLLDTEQLALSNVKFVVQPAGRAKVLREKKKNVHAFVRGEFEGFESTLDEDIYFQPFHRLDYVTVNYNPYISDKFQATVDEKVRNIEWQPQVLFRQGKVWLYNRNGLSWKMS